MHTVCVLVCKDVNVGTSARELFNKHINDLSSSTCHQLVLNTVSKIDEMLHDSLRPKVDLGVNRAVCTANATVDKWGAKVSPIRPLSGTSSFSNDTVQFTRFFVYIGDCISHFFLEELKFDKY